MRTPIVASRPFDRRTLLKASAALLPAVAIVRPTAAQIPEPVEIGFDIRWRDASVGRHHVTLRPSSASLSAQVEIDVDVSLFGRRVYVFRHRSLEQWQDRRLAGFQGWTDDNGTVSKVEVGRVGGKLAIHGVDGRIEAGPDLMPASYWHPDMIGRAVWLDGVKGRIARSTVHALGTSTVATAEGEIDARQYRLEGDIDAKLWYADGRWVGFGLTGPQGTLIDYRLATPLEDLAKVPPLAARFA